MRPTENIVQQNCVQPTPRTQTRETAYGRTHPLSLIFCMELLEVVRYENAYSYRQTSTFSTVWTVYFRGSHAHLNCTFIYLTRGAYAPLLVLSFLFRPTPRSTLRLQDTPPRHSGTQTASPKDCLPSAPPCEQHCWRP